MARSAEGGRGRGAGGDAERMGLAASSGPARGGRRVDRLSGAARPSHGVSRIPGQRVVHWQRGGGERLQDGGGPTSQTGRDALGRRRCPGPVPPPCPVPQREGSVGRLLETEFLFQLIACITN